MSLLLAIFVMLVGMEDVPVCYASAYVYGSPEASEWEYRVTTPSAPVCAPTEMWIDRTHGFWIISFQGYRAEIPIPREPGWHRCWYAWGAERAFCGGQPLSTRFGPDEVY